MTKVVHISTSDTGGAGLAAYRLHHALLSNGVESRMLVASKYFMEDEIVEAHRYLESRHSFGKVVVLND